MKFIKLESRGGNYLVVAENVAWLRTAENGQTSVGIIGGQPLLVVGSIEEVAEKILTATAEQEPPAPVAAPPVVAEPIAPAPVATPPVAVAPAPPAALPAEPAPPPPVAPAPASTPMVAEPVAAEPVAVAPVAPPPPPPTARTSPAANQHAPSRAAVPAAPPTPRLSERPRQVAAHSMSLSERVARAAAPKVKAGTQRFMGLAE